MRLHRFYIEHKIRGNSEVVLFDKELIHQFLHVFRFKLGTVIIVFDGLGSEYEAEIISLNRKEVVLKIQTEVFHDLTPVNDSNFVSLYLSVIKKSNFELATEKCTEIGVSEIHPIISDRSEKKDLNLERLNKIVKEASEQSGRLFLPKVLDITDLETAVSQALQENKFCIAFHTGDDSCDETVLNSTEGNRHVTVKKVAVFVGPEGGWTEAEMKLFKKNKFKICSLGHNILRAETAAMVAVWEAFHR